LVENQNNLFIAILNALYNNGVLKDLILIGSWCQFFYRYYFNNTPEIPAVRTLDIDILVPNPPKIRKEVNLPQILADLGFRPIFSYTTGYTKYSTPELELEFLTPELGKGHENKPHKIKKLHIEVQGLRYLNLLQAYIMELKYENISIILPEPAAFVLHHKFIIFKRRSKKEKAEKDLMIAGEIGQFLLKKGIQKNRLIEIYNELPKKWQNKVLNNLKEHSESLYDLLKNE
jgi:hypothetical protein